MAKFIVLTLVAAFAVVAHGITLPTALTNVDINGICTQAQGLPTTTQLPGVTAGGLDNTCKTAKALDLTKCTRIPPVVSGSTVTPSAVLGYTCDLSGTGDKVYDAAGKEVSNPSVVIDQDGNAVVKAGNNQVTNAVINDANGKLLGFTDDAGKFYSFADPNVTVNPSTGVVTYKTPTGATIEVTEIKNTEYTITTDTNGKILSITPK